MFLNSESIPLGEVLNVSNLQGPQQFKISGIGLGKIKVISEEFEISSDSEEWANELHYDLSTSMYEDIYVRPINEIGSGTVRIEADNEQ
jgi:hypothetical protein